jgi:hypothetical protein
MLDASLTAEQRESYLAKGYVSVDSRTYPGRTYRVDGWRPVSVHENGRFVGAVCIRPREYMPGPDVLLARKLMIEGAEADFLRAGNWLQPAWRPAGAAPTIVLLLALLGPWILQLRTFGAPALAGAGVLAAALAAWVLRTQVRTVRQVFRQRTQ